MQRSHLSWFCFFVLHLMRFLKLTSTCVRYPSIPGRMLQALIHCLVVTVRVRLLPVSSVCIPNWVIAVFVGPSLRKRVPSFE
jgi:hypothetical protein